MLRVAVAVVGLAAVVAPACRQRSPGLSPPASPEANRLAPASTYLYFEITNLEYYRANWFSSNSVEWARTPVIKGAAKYVAKTYFPALSQPEPLAMQRNQAAGLLMAVGTGTFFVATLPPPPQAAGASLAYVTGAQVWGGDAALLVPAIREWLAWKASEMAIADRGTGKRRWWAVTRDGQPAGYLLAIREWLIAVSDQSLVHETFARWERPGQAPPSLAEAERFRQCLRRQPPGFGLVLFADVVGWRAAAAASANPALRQAGASLGTFLPSLEAAMWTPSFDKTTAPVVLCHDFAYTLLHPKTAGELPKIFPPLEDPPDHLAGPETAFYIPFGIDAARAWAWSGLGDTAWGIAWEESRRVSQDGWFESLRGTGAWVIDWPDDAPLPWVALVLPKTGTPPPASPWKVAGREFQIEERDGMVWVTADSEAMAYFRERGAPGGMLAREPFPALRASLADFGTPSWAVYGDTDRFTRNGEKWVRSNWTWLAPWLRERGLEAPEVLPDASFHDRYKGGGGILVWRPDEHGAMARNELVRHAGFWALFYVGTEITLEVFHPELTDWIDDAASLRPGPSPQKTPPP